MDENDLTDAVNKIADKRELYGFSQGIKKASLVIMDVAIELFRNGKDDIAPLYREMSERLADLSYEHAEVWNKVDDSEYWEVVERVKE